VWAASWFHDGSAPGPAKTGYGHNWVIAAIVVRLPMVRRPVAIPVLAKLVIKGTSSASRLWLARRMTQTLAEALPGRAIHVVADSAYAGGELKKLPARVTWTTRLRKDAALHALPPARTGKRGRPRTKGNRLPALDALAATTAFTEVTVTRYGKTAAISAAAITCLWPSVFGTRPVTVVLIRDQSVSGYDLALVTTDTAASAEFLAALAFERAWVDNDLAAVMGCFAEDPELVSAPPFTDYRHQGSGPTRQLVQEQLSAGVRMDLTHKLIARERVTWTLRKRDEQDGTDPHGQAEAQFRDGKITSLRLGTLPPDR